MLSEILHLTISSTEGSERCFSSRILGIFRRFSDDAFQSAVKCLDSPVVARGSHGNELEWREILACCA
jgi:hypothetical protein